MIRLTKNLNIIILFIIFFTVETVNSQSYEKIINQNTVFIHYNGQEEVELRRALGTHETNPDKKPYYYQFFSFNSKGEKRKLPIMTLHFRIYEKTPKEKELIFFRVHKSFLKKNKEIIMNWKFMKKIGNTKTVDLLKNAKKIFLIDNEQIKNKTILIKEVRLSLPTIE